MKALLKRIILIIFHSRNSLEAFNNIRRWFEKKNYKEKINANDIINMMVVCGLKKGSNIFIHSSWDEFYNYEGNANEFIEKVLDYIGPEGTLAMPAFPLFYNQSNVFDVKKTPTAAGFLAERFRRYKGVKRSINIQHSVCAIGPMSDYLVKDHHRSITCWDEFSPYYRLSQINAIVYSFGLGGYFIGTIVHCADSILKNEHPFFANFFTKEVTYSYIDYENNKCVHTYFTSSDYLKSKFTKRSRSKVVKKYFDKSKYFELKLSNLTIEAYDAKYTIEKLTELGRNGITLYIEPKIKEFLN